MFIYFRFRAFNFGLVGDYKLAEKIKLEIDKELKMDIKFNSYLSPFGARGVRVMEFTIFLLFYNLMKWQIIIIYIKINEMS